MRYLCLSSLLAILTQLNVTTATSQEIDTSLLNTQEMPSRNSLSKPSPPPEEPEVRYTIVEEMPLFPGCADLIATKEEKYQESQKKLDEYIYQHLEYPTEAMLLGIQGRVVVRFVFELNGEITNALCVKDIGYGCGEEAVRVINSMNQLQKKWTPAKRLGKPVAVQCTLPIHFKL